MLRLNKLQSFSPIGSTKKKFILNCAVVGETAIRERAEETSWLYPHSDTLKSSFFALFDFSILCSFVCYSVAMPALLFKHSTDD